MKTSFKFHVSLVEDYSKEITLGAIRNNLKTCFDKQVYLFRGISGGADKIGHKEPRENRSSQTSNNLILQFSNHFVDGIPPRKRSYFATNSYEEAGTFGSVYLIVPHDNVGNFAVIEDDFNLKEIPSLSKCAKNLSDFGYKVGSAAFVLSELYRREEFDLSKDNLKERVREFERLSGKVLYETDSSKEEFDQFCEQFIPLAKLFVEVEGKLVDNSHYFPGWREDLVLSFLTVFGKEYDYDIKKALTEGMTKESLGIVSGTFDEITDFLRDNSHKNYEVWFEGRISYFSMQMIFDHLRKDDPETEKFRFDTQLEINDGVSEFLSKRLKV